MQTLRSDPASDGPFYWLMDSLMGAMECAVESHPSMSQIEYVVSVEITAMRDTKEALTMLRGRKLSKRDRMARDLMKAFLGNLNSNPVSRTWEKGIKVSSDRRVRVAEKVTRFMHALNLITHKKTPLIAAQSTLARYKNGAAELS